MRSRVVLAACADVACIVTFAAVGRASHDESGAAAEVLRIAWPFLAGGVAGWAATRAWRAPLRAWPEGAGIWAATLTLGMALRGLTGGGLAVTFLVVATLALGALLVGWRGAAALVSAGLSASRRGSRRSGAAAR